MTDEPTAWYLVATDDGSDDAYTTCREAGFDLADDADAGVILYDRTSESKLTNPYPAGPWSDEDDALSPEDELTPHELRELGRAYLAEQMEDGRRRGIPTRAHLAVNTGAEALQDAVERYRPARVVFPAEIRDDGGLLDRVRHNTVADLLSDSDCEVLLIDKEGRIASGA
jgi:hypothetical protein